VVISRPKRLDELALEDEGLCHRAAGVEEHCIVVGHVFAQLDLMMASIGRSCECGAASSDVLNLIPTQPDVDAWPDHLAEDRTRELEAAVRGEAIQRLAERDIITT
jgi:hypothetical protein